MKKFRFPLRSVETVRSLHELRAREAFSIAVRAYMEAETHLLRVREQRRELAEILVAERRATLRPADQVAFLHAYQVEVEREALATKTTAEAKAAMDARRERWIEARRDLRVIENLEEKARHAHQREVEHEEQKVQDDRTNATIGRAPLLTP